MSFLRFSGKLIALLVGVGGLRYAATCDRGFPSVAWLGYFVYWLPPSAILSFVLLISLTWRLKLNEFVFSAVLGAIAWTQFIALWRDHNSQFALSVMPLALVIFVVISWACDLREPPERAVKGLNRYGHWLLICVVLVVLVDLTTFTMRVRRGFQRYDESIVQRERKNRELKGLKRAAWLMGLAFLPADFSEEQFLRDKSCHLQYWGDFHWDSEKERLIITQPVFDERTRERLLPHSDAVLEHPLLKTGPRDDLQGGVLTRKFELGCRIEWTVDVMQLTDSSDMQEVFMHNMDFIGRKLVQELAL